MRKYLLLIFAIMMVSFLSAQTIIFQEGFETTTVGLTTTADLAGVPTTNFDAWAASTNLYKSGIKADTNTLQPGKTIYLTSNSFATTGNSFVVLEFAQICKLYFSDGGNIEVSIDNGTTWTSLGLANYLGSGNLISSGGLYKFSESAYTDWLAGDTATKPTNLWWKNEKFDISSIAANQANVKIRFKYTSSGNPAGAGRYGWLLDDIKVTVSPSELYPPTITMISYPTDTTYYGGPYTVSAYIKDGSGIDTAYVMYQVGNGVFTHLAMVKSPVVDSLYTATIPFVGYWKWVSYNITARDASGAHNLAYKPATAYYTFFPKFNIGGNVIVGTATTSQNYPFKSNADYTKSASLYLASNINKYGLITSLAWNVSTAQTTIPIPVKIYIKQTSSGAMTADNWANLKNGAILVYDGIQTFLSTGWKTIALTTPFSYTSGNLMVLCEANNGTAASATPSFYYTTGATGSHQYFASNAVTTGVLSTLRPNITIGFMVSPYPTPDAGISQVVYPTSSVLAGTSFNYDVKIKNFTNDSLKKVKVWYSLDGGTPAFTLWNPGSIALLKDSTFTYTAASFNLAVGIHNVKVWTDMPNDSVDMNFQNDTSSYSFYACSAPLSGNYTVGGTGANFPTFSDVLVGLTQCGINGPVVFNVNPGTYSDQLTIPEIVGASAINTITFKAANNDSTSVIMNRTSTSLSNWIVKLNGADYVTFKNIKFAPNDVVNSAAVVLTAGATNNNFIGNYFAGYSGTAASQTSIAIEGTASVNKNNVIQGNYFYQGAYAISVKGLSTAILKNTVIKNNTVINSISYGIYAQYVDSCLIDSNTVSSSVVNSGNKYGIYVSNANVLNRITKNTVFLTAATTMYGILVENSVSTDTTKGLIANNFVSLQNGAGAAYGIRLLADTKFKVYANSVFVTSASTTDTRGINITGTSSFIEVINNNAQSNIYPHFYEASSVSISNYNNYYSSTNKYGYYTSVYVDFTSLSALVAAYLKDSNSVSTIPYFNSTSDLHTFNGLLKGMGTNLTDVATDIDGNPRLNPPCIGADEFLPPAQDAALISLLKPIGGCGLTTTEDVKVVIKNVGSASIAPNTITARYKLDSLNAVVSELVNRTINVGDTIQYTFTTKVNLAVNPLTLNDTLFKIRAWADLTGDFAHANDSSALFSFSSMFTPPPPTATGATVFYSSTATLTAVSTKPLVWYKTATSTAVIGNGPSFTTPVLLATDTFYVAAKTSQSSVGYVGPLAPLSTAGTGGGIGTYLTFTALSNTVLQAVDIFPYGTGPGTVTIALQSSTGAAITSAVINCTGTASPLSPAQTAVLNFPITAGTSYRLVATAWTGGVTNLYRDNVGTFPYTLPGMLSITGASLSPYYYFFYNFKVGITVEGCVSTRVPVIANVLSYLHEAGLSKISTPTGCALYQVPITVKIFNHSYIDTLKSTNCTVTYKLDNGSYITPEAINISINPFDTASYTFTTLANFTAPLTDRYIKVTAVVMTPGDAYSQNDTLVKDSILSRYTPPAPTASNVNVFNGSTATLSANASVGNILWWDALTAGLNIGQGSPYTTPFFMYATDTFYVEATTNYAAAATVGTGTLVNTTTGYPSPYGQFYNGSKEQYLITKAELNALGIQAGVISSLSFDVVSAPGAALTNYTIKLGHTSLTALSAWISGLTQVYTNASLLPTTGWNTYTFTTPFVWNGIDNLLIETCFNNYPNGYTTNGVVNQTATSFVSTLNYHSDSDGALCTPGSGTATVYSQRPNMKIEGMVPGCSSVPRVPVIVTVSPPPINDAGITTLVNPVGNTPSGVSTPVKVKIKNFGQANLTSATVQWTLNGALKPNYSFTGNIPSGSDSTITIANETFAGGLYCVKAWTKNPNGAAIDSTGSNDTLFSTCFTACLNGTYTIGDTANGNFHNFPNFTSAVSNLTVAGVCGPVTFLVDTGTFTEQVRIPQINGASATNTITFRSQSNDSTKVILQYAATLSATSYTLRLDSAKYVTVKGITIKSTGVTYGRPVEAINTSTNNTISNCVLEMPVSTSSGFNGIYDYGIASCLNTYQYNRIVNGYYGIYLYGASTTSLKPGTKLIGNKVLNFYYYGIYSYYQDSVQIIGNEITSPLAVYGLYTYYNQNACKILKNKISLSSASTQYGLYVYYMTGTATAHGLVANNMVSLSGGSISSTAYGMYVYSSNYQDIYYNSVNVAVPSPTYGRAVYHYGGTFLNFANNCFVNSGGGMAWYVSTATAINVSDYNNLYTTGNVLGYWNSGNTNTLADWKLASSKDPMSVSVDPTYTSTSDLHLQSTVLSNLGTPIPGITDDIDGFTRNTISPTIGADEVPLLPYDAGVSFISRPSSLELEAASFPVKVAVKNYGTSPITSVVVTYVLNGGTPVAFTYNPTVPIASLATDSVQFPTNMTVTAGNNSICVYTTLTGDINTFNNQICKNFWGAPLYDAQLIDIQPMPQGCGLTLDTVKLLILNQGVMAINGNFTASYQKLGGAAVVTENITATIAPGVSYTYVFNTLCDVSVTNADSVFKIKSWLTLQNDNMPLNNNDTIAVSSLHTPLNPTTANISIPYATTGTLTANSPTNDPLKWYDVPAAGTSLYTGSPFITPILFATDTFFVEANSAYSASGVLGNGTIQNTTSGYPSPYGQFYNGCKEQYLITKAELNALGIQAGPITSLGFDVVSYTSSTALINYTIKIGHTNQTAMSAWISGLTQVYSVATYLPVTGWNIHSFSTPFVWNGIDNIVVENCFNNYPNGYTTNGIVNQTTTTFVSTLDYHSDSDGALCTPGSGTPTTYSQRPNMKIQGMVPGCSSARLPAIVTVGAQPLKDASAISIVSPVTGINLTTTETVKVLVKNYGSTPIYNFPVMFKLSHGATAYPAVSQLMTDTIYTDSTKVISFTQTVNLSSNNQPDTFKIVAWTDMVGDPTHQNDTTKSTIINLPPVYCISKATYTAYENIGQVILAGMNHGIATPVTSNPNANKLYSDYSDSAYLRPVIQPGLSYPLNINLIWLNTYSYAGYAKVFIDYNRNGTWELPGEIAWEGAYAGAAAAALSGNITVPYTALPGLTKMRIVAQYGGSTATVVPCGTYSYGETEDYIVSIMPPIPHDAGMNKIAMNSFYPYSVSNSMNPYFFIRNYGSDSLMTASVRYTINGVAGPASPYTWTPTSPLPSLHSLQIDSMSLAVNLTDGLNKIVSYTTGIIGDTMYNNDTVKTTVFKEHLASVPYADNFEVNSYWFASDTANGYPINNLWAQGVPLSASPSLNAVHSPVNAWVTKLSGNYPASNYSVLYSPVFDISIMQPDTLKFWQWRQFGPGASGVVQYKNSVGGWDTLGVMNDANATNWYNDTTKTWRGIDTVWKETKYWVKSLTNLGSTLQFRFIFASSVSTTVMKGWAIDDVELTLAPIPFDGGVTAIVTPTSPSAVGDLITVSVTVKNFGTSSLSAIPVKYQVGTGTIVSETMAGPLAPGATGNYTFTTTFHVGLQNYQICSWTAVAGDLYTQNDKNCKQIVVNPAQKNVGVSQLVQPNAAVSANSSVTIKVRIKNYGLQTQTSIPVSYQRGTQTPVNETWTGSIAYGDSADYSFTQPVSVPIGTSFSLCSWTKLANDAYPFNDSLCKSIVICNVAAAGIISGPATVSVGNTYTYTVPTIANATSYNWVYTPSTGVTIVNNGASVSVTFGTGANTNGVLSVNGVGATCSGNPSTLQIGTGIEEFDVNSLWLGQNMPNPTTGITNIEYNLPASGEVKFDIMNLFGQKVYSMTETEIAGKHKVNLDLNKLADGIYYYTLEFKGKRLTKKMLINK